jgi:tetratricopeptide (TPR) repeat protein
LGHGRFDRPNAPWSGCFALLGGLLEKGRTLGFDGRPTEAAAMFDVGLNLLLTGRSRSSNIDESFTADGYLAQFFFYKGCVCYELCDYTAAEGLFRRCIDHYAVSFKDGLPRAAAETLANAYKNFSTVLMKQGKQAEAERWAARAVELSADLHDEDESGDSLEVLTSSMIQQAGVHLESGRPHAARDLMQDAAGRWEQVVGGRLDHPQARVLAKIYGNLAVAVNRCGDHRESLPIFDRAVAILDRAVRLQGRVDVEPELAHVLLNREVPLRLLKRWGEARSLLDDLVSRLERLIAEQRGGDELQHRLALALSELAYIDVQQNFEHRAGERYRRCIQIWRELVYDRGRREFLHYLESMEGNLRNVSI